MDKNLFERQLREQTCTETGEITMKHYVMSTEEHGKEAIGRSGNIPDSYMDTSKKEAVEETA